jgi:hypothetical protein
VLDQVIRERAPGPFDKVEARVVKLLGSNRHVAMVVDKLGGGRRGTRRVLAALAGVLLLGILFSTLCMATGEDEDTVMITVINAPPRSKIFIDDYLVEKNPFRVRRGEALVPLRVEARGRKKFKISLTPNEDQVVDVAAEEVIKESQVAEQEAADEAAEEAAAESAEAKSEQKPTERPGKPAAKKTEPKQAEPKKTKQAEPKKTKQSDPGDGEGAEQKKGKGKKKKSKFRKLIDKLKK